MRKTLSILYILLISHLLLADNVSLDWSDNKIITIGEDSVEVPYFAEADYVDASMLPYYQYAKPLSEDEALGFEYDVSIINIKSGSTNAVIDLNLLDKNYKIESNISCARGVYALEVRILPFKYDKGIYRLESFDLQINKKPLIRLKNATSWFAENSVLAKGNWVKVGVKKTGIYKLTYSQIRNMGLDPENLSIFTGQAQKLSFKIQDYIDDIKEIPVYDSGKFFLFYASSQDVWDYKESKEQFYHIQHPYWNENYYYLSDDIGQQKRISIQEPLNGDIEKTYTSYIAYDVIEPQEESVDNSGDDWYSEKITNGNSFEHTFSFENILLEPAKMEMRLAAQSVSASHTMNTYIDGEKLSSISLSTTTNSHTDFAAFGITKNYTFTPKSSSIDASMAFSSADVMGKGFVDYFSVNVSCDLNLYDDFLCFRNYPSDAGLVKYEIKNCNANTQVWSVINPFDIRHISSKINSTILSFNAQDDMLNEFVAVNIDGAFETPKSYGKLENQNLHGITVPNMVIITVSEFLEEAENLADIHRKDGLIVDVVDQDLIFNEFSGGKADITAIRWFMKSLYERDSDIFRYLLLLGDADVNNRMYEGDPLRLMCYQSDESFNRADYYVSDDYFGFLDDNEGQNINSSDKVDIGIGRIPVTSVSDVQTVVNKIDKYINDSKPTPWKNRICIVADDQDNNTHVNDANLLAEKLRRENPSMAIKKVFIDAFEQVKEASGDTYPDAKSLVDQYIEEGVLIWGYSGHGSPTALASEGMMHINDVNSYENIANLPLWVTATCDFCPYDHNEDISSGERVLLNSQGGGIGLFTTTRLVYSSSNYVITNNFYNYILNYDKNGEKLRLGDVVRLTKQATGTGSNKRKFAFIGDPALQLLYAEKEWSVKTDSINGVKADLFTDTLQALSKMSVSGHVTKADGTIDEDFNGVMYPTVYDKISNMTTLGNDSDSEPMDFVMWNSILFRGKTEVINGRFSFNFMLPKDLDYTPGNGRIEYFICSDEGDVNGHFENFNIGGFNENFEADNEGPLIEAYMNSTGFIDGDVVNTNPVLIADIFDESGINTSGNSIGHDITVKLNNDPNTIEILNNNYESNVGSFKEGRLLYSFKDLEEGDYTLTLKLWDMQNNSSTKELNFEVRDDSKPDISAIYCYPNPVSLSSGKQVRFVAIHDRPENNLEVKLNIYDSQAKLVYQSSDFIYTQNNEIYFDWTPTHSFNAGLYFYRIIIKDGDHSSTGKSKKLLIVH